MTAATEAAPAKINLTLHVTGRRADGYHLLDSLVVFAQAGDAVSLTRTPGLVIAGPEGQGLSVGPDNLVTRAAALMGAAGQGVRLDKHLPVASGIGGGSTDAAATLRLLARVNGLSEPSLDDQLTLGADVPVCMRARPARMQGIGEQVSTVAPLPSFWLVLVNPRIGLSTPDVFSQLAQRDNPPMVDPLPQWPCARSFFDWLAHQRNDLQAPACALAPVVSDVLRSLAGMPDCALARMSGSGATCFGLFERAASARAAAAAIARACPGWWVCATGLFQADDG